MSAKLLSYTTSDKIQSKKKKIHGNFYSRSMNHFLVKNRFTKTRNGENIMLLPVEMPGWLTLKAAHFWKQFYAA